MKKILVISQYYHPENFRITDICEKMVLKGYEVHVVTGYPNYPEGRIYDGYGIGKNTDEEINGVSVHRCFLIPRGTSSLQRMLNYYSYSVSATHYVLSSKCTAKDGSPFDVVFCNQLSPILMGQAAIAYKKKYNVPAILYCLDLWPESLVIGGVARSSILYRHFMAVSRKIYKAMDSILVTSQQFIDYFESIIGVEKNNVFYLPQYAESLFSINGDKKNSEQINLVFAGNIGVAQNVEIIIKAAIALQHLPICFHIIGDGKNLESIKDKASTLSNIIFYGRLPLDSMPKFYQLADAFLVTLVADEQLSRTLPGKVQSYMAAGKPIIASTDGETATIIKEANCGYCGQANDEEAFIHNIKHFMTSLDKEELGKNGKLYYEKNFSEAVFFNKLERFLAI